MSVLRRQLKGNDMAATTTIKSAEDLRVLRVLRGFESLNEAGKQEVIKQIESYHKIRRLDERVQKELGMVMGPLPVPCPCCGR